MFRLSGVCLAERRKSFRKKQSPDKPGFVQGM